MAKRLGLSKSGVFSRVRPREAWQQAVVQEYEFDDRDGPSGGGQAYAGLAREARPFSTSGLGRRRPLRDAQVQAEVTGCLVAPVA